MLPRRPQDAPKTASRLLQDALKAPWHGSKPPPRRTTTPSGWSQLRLAVLKAAKKPSKPRCSTLWTSNLDPPDFDFGPSIRRLSILQKDRQNAALLLFVLARWRGRSFPARWIRRARPMACAWRTEFLYPNVPSHLPFLLISFLTFLFLSIYQGYT